MPLVPTHAQPPPSSTSQSGTFVIADELILTHHYHPKFIVYIGVIHSVGLDKYIMTYNYHYGVIQSIFT